MHIRLETEGGFAAFPGLNRPLELDTAQLPAEEAARLEALVAAAHFFTQPAVTPPPPGAADYKQYTLTVERAGHMHTVKVTDPIAAPALRELVAALEAQRR